MYGLRFFQDQDAAFWQALHHEAYRPHVEQIWGWDPKIQAEFAAQELARVSSGRFIVTRAGEDVGYLSYDWEADGTLYLSNLVLTPATRGQGLGTAILQDLMALARRHARPMRLRTFETNPAQHLYQRLGFELVEHNLNDHHLYFKRHPS